MIVRSILLAVLLALFLTACNGSDDPGNAQVAVIQATLPPEDDNAPLVTATLTRTPAPTLTSTPTVTMTHTPTATHTPIPSATLTETPIPTATHTLPPSATVEPTATPTPSPTATVTASPIPTIAPTQPLITLTPPAADNAPEAYANPTAMITTPEGWSCGDFPCADEIDGFLNRIQVPQGFDLSFVGRFPGQPKQIALGPDGRIYATVLENGTQVGAVFALNPVSGEVQRYSSERFFSPIGLAFRPGTDELYVSARQSLDAGAGIWRVNADGSRVLITDVLPCCFDVIGNQPNGLTFGPDGWLYVGIGALTDRAEPENPEFERFARLHPLEAAIVRINPLTSDVEIVAQGIRNPYDVAFGADGQLYATDNGLLEGPGDRLLAVNNGANYGWPYWRTRGCEACPPRGASLTVAPDLLALPDYTLPRGIVAYTGDQFPVNMFNSLFVAFWNGTVNAQRVVRVELGNVPPPDSPPETLALYEPEPFVTGLIRPIDVILDAEGRLLVADFIYGHVWRVSYIGPDFVRELPPYTPVFDDIVEATAAVTAEVTSVPTMTPGNVPLFVTSTPRN